MGDSIVFLAALVLQWMGFGIGPFLLIFVAWILAAFHFMSSYGVKNLPNILMRYAHILLAVVAVHHKWDNNVVTIAWVGIAMYMCWRYK